MYLAFMSGIEGWAGLHGVTPETTTVDALMKSGYTEEAALNFNALWSTCLGIWSYNMGIFSGIITGLTTSWLHNKFVDTKLPAMFAFFAGTKWLLSW